MGRIEGLKTIVKASLLGVKTPVLVQSRTRIIALYHMWKIFSRMHALRFVGWTTLDVVNCRQTLYHTKIASSAKNWAVLTNAKRHFGHQDTVIMMRRSTIFAL